MFRISGRGVLAAVTPLVGACGAAPVQTPVAAPVPASVQAPPTPSPAASPLDALRARLLTAEPGCVALSADGARALIVVERPASAGPVRELHDVSLVEDPAVFPLGDNPAEFRAEAEALWAGDALAAWRGGEPPLPCTGAVPQAAGAMTLPVGAGVTLAASSFALVARPTTPAAGAPPDEGRALELWSAAERDPDDTSEAEIVGAFFAPGRPNLFVELRRRRAEAPAGDAVGSSTDVWIRPVAGAELGVAPCAQRPAGAPVVAPPPKLFVPEAPAEACLAMTPDGRRAALRVHRSDRFAQDESGQGTFIAWFGEGPAPAVDLGCLAERCTRKQLARIASDAATLGLVPCPEVGETVAVAGVAVPFLQAAGALWLRLPDGPRFVRRLRTSAHDGGDHEAFAGAWQAGNGPVFVALENADTGLSELRVAVLDEEALGLCPAASMAPPSP